MELFPSLNSYDIIHFPSTFIIIPQGKTSSIKMDFLYRKLYSFFRLFVDEFHEKVLYCPKRTGG